MFLQKLLLVLIPLLVSAKDDYYYKACSKLILKQTAYASYKAMEAEDMYMALSENTDFQDSIADCIETCAGLATTVESKQDHICKVSWGYYHYICDYYHHMASCNWKQVSARIAENPLSTATDNSTLRIKIPSSTLEANNIIPAGLGFYQMRRYPVLMGWGVVIYVIGIFGIQTIFNLINLFCPRVSAWVLQLSVIKDFRRYFTLAPMFGAKASRVLNNYNQRLHYVWISGFVLLNILFSCLGYDGQEVSPYYYGDYTHLYSSAIAYRTGYLSMFCLPIAFLFATRNNFLILLTGWNLDVFNLWHRWIGRVCFLLAVAHSSAYYIHYNIMKEVAAEWKKAYWYWGFIATLFFGIMCVQGSKQIRALAYDLFVIVHIILAVFVMVGLYVHLWFTNQCKPIWYTCVGLWALDHVLRFARIVINGNVITAQLTAPTLESVMLHVPHTEILKYPPGSFVFLHLLHPVLFWQSHPFTVVPDDTKKGFKIVLKHRSGLTKWLYNQVQKGSIKVLVDGPYANPISFKQYDTVSFIAGGVGVTAVYSHLMSLTPEEMSSKSISFDWIVPSIQSGRYFVDEIHKIKSLPIDFKIHVKHIDGVDETESLASQDTIEKETAIKEGSVVKSCCGRADAPSLLRRIMLTKMCVCEKSMAYFVCGPSTLNREAREIMADQIVLTNKYIQLFDESFCM